MLLINPIVYPALLLTLLFPGLGNAQQHQTFDTWQEGYLDIHHINTARGNATFFVFPDGTTMLFDAGAKQVPPGKEHEYFPVPPHDSLSAGGWIAHYIKQMCPAGRMPQIDYAVISHFHNDHYGQIDSASRKSDQFDYQLSGITQVGDQLPIKTLIDRGYPAYNFPLDLKTFYKNDKTFTNYLAFIREQKIKRKLVVESLMAGSNDQIRLKIHPAQFRTFSVRNVKANATIWSGKANNTVDYKFNSSLVKEGELDENALSLALKISYGPFDYYTGGDLTGYTQWGDFDTETPVAKAVGKVEVLALNHHGYYDATNTLFLKTLLPTVVVHQVIHDPHYQPGVLKRLAAYPLHVFTYNMHEITRKTFSADVSKLYKSTQGHVVIRVMPGGSHYYVYILDDRWTDLRLIRQFGPYTSNTKK